MTYYRYYMTIKLFPKGYNCRVTSCPGFTMLFTIKLSGVRNLFVASVFCSKHHITNESRVNVYVEYSQTMLNLESY